MNCEPGDRAFIVGCAGTGWAGDISRAIVGRVVTVVNLRKPVSDSTCTAELVWHLEAPIHIELDGRGYVVNGLADWCLRPIRDAGDDARDETLDWLPTPDSWVVDPEVRVIKEAA